jgi:hypothetical protein
MTAKTHTRKIESRELFQAELAAETTSFFYAVLFHG